MVQYVVLVYEAGSETEDPVEAEGDVAVEVVVGEKDVEMEVVVTDAYSMTVVACVVVGVATEKEEVSKESWRETSGSRDEQAATITGASVVAEVARAAEASSMSGRSVVD